MSERAPSGAAGGVSVRPLCGDELGEADRIFRLAFGTFLGLPDPLAFMGDAGFVRTRWRADPPAAFAAERWTASWPAPTSPPTGAASASSGR